MLLAALGLILDGLVFLMLLGILIRVIEITDHLEDIKGLTDDLRRNRGK